MDKEHQLEDDSLRDREPVKLFLTLLIWTLFFVFVLQSYKDLRGTVKQISEFLGKSFSDEIIDAITDHCSFESMKNNPMTNPDTIIAQRFGKIADGKSFMRKGKTIKPMFMC